MAVSHRLVSAWGASLGLVATEVGRSLHVRKNLGESLTVSGDPLARVSKWQFLVGQEISWLSVEVCDILLTRGASHRSKRLLREHRVISVRACRLLGEQLHDLSDLLTELRESLHDVVFIRELAQNLVYHIFELLHDSVFEVV